MTELRLLTQTRKNRIKCGCAPIRVEPGFCANVDMPQVQRWLYCVHEHFHLLIILLSSRYLDNIISNPTEQKYLKIRLNNKAFQVNLTIASSHNVTAYIWCSIGKSEWYSGRGTVPGGNWFPSATVTSSRWVYTACVGVLNSPIQLQRKLYIV